MRGRAREYAEPLLPFTGGMASTLETSYAAAEAHMGADSQRRRVLQLIRQAGDFGLTDVEIQIALCLDGSTERPRRIELLRAGLIQDSGKTRMTPSGRQAVVWIGGL